MENELKPIDKLSNETLEELKEILETCKDFTDKELKKAFIKIKKTCMNYREFRVKIGQIKRWENKENFFYLEKIEEMIKEEIDNLNILDCQTASVIEGGNL